MFFCFIKCLCLFYVRRAKSTATPLSSIYFNQKVYDVQARTDFDTEFRALGWFRMHWKIIN